MTVSINAMDIQSGMKVLHSGEFHEVAVAVAVAVADADVEVSNQIVRVATITGGHLAFAVACRVKARSE